MTERNHADDSARRYSHVRIIVSAALLFALFGPLVGLLLYAVSILVLAFSSTSAVLGAVFYFSFLFFYFVLIAYTVAGIPALLAGLAIGFLSLKETNLNFGKVAAVGIGAGVLNVGAAWIYTEGRWPQWPGPDPLPQTFLCFATIASTIVCWLIWRTARVRLEPITER